MKPPLEAHENDLCRSEERTAQSSWAELNVRDRLQFVGVLRHLIAENAEALAVAAAAVSSRPLEEKLVSEVLPLADACRWLSRRAARILAPRRHGAWRGPAWMGGLDFEVQRQPFGIVLVIGPGNYPLFLPAVQALHALVAGNAVQVKPAPGTRPVALLFARLAFEAGLDPALLNVLSEDVDAARETIAAGVDKVVFTGSSENGRHLLGLLAETNTPAVMELSGQDVVLVLADADLALVLRALRFGARLNGGATCIAPRRLVVDTAIADELSTALVATGGPVLFIERVQGPAAAITQANAGGFGLGAAIFSSDIALARAVAARLKTGFVTINDLIVPTADPRMPFGGTKASGYGTTRGAEGLLELTFPHVVAVRRGRARPHFDDPAPEDARLFSAYLRLAHGRSRLQAIPAFLRALFQRQQTREKSPS